MARTAWAWAGSVREFLGSTASELVESLSQFHVGSMGMPAAGSQVTAWIDEVNVLQDALGQASITAPEANEWSIVLEYELPMEGGRRPDAVLLLGGSIAVLEFKTGSKASPGQVDQVVAYARDLSDYHGASHGRHVTPMLVLTGSEIAIDFEPAVITGPRELSHYLIVTASPGMIDVAHWLSSPYEPLPTLVAAARRIFREESLPHVRSALSSGIPKTLESVGEVIRQTQHDRHCALVLIAGVPGSGKTLVGLRLVYELSDLQGRAIFLSGNGPLVQVLQDALKSKVFVRDLHAFIKTYGFGERAPNEHVVVFDEAQRAWDAGFMKEKRNIERSEPELLTSVAEQLSEWGVLVGLVGQGQEIFSGEEGGIGQWRDAILSHADPSRWTVYCPPSLQNDFADLAVTSLDELDLTTSLRSRRADNLHEWVNYLLTGNLTFAARVASRIDRDDQRYPLYVTRSLDEARSYAIARYVGEPDARFGLLVAAHAKTPRKYGVDNHYMEMRKLKVGRWFNAPKDDPMSCCSFSQPATEFQVQGLELDLPILCWGEDLVWDGKVWRLKPARARYTQQHPEELLRNAYRVLLTRGRDGLVVFLPPEAAFDLTEVALLAAGFRPLETAIEFMDRLNDLATGIEPGPTR